MKFLVTGSRDWLSVKTIEMRLGNFTFKDFLVQGDARGADRIAKDIWTNLAGEDRVLSYPAQWGRYGGKAAGPIRNRQMLSENLDIDVVIAFNNDISASKGTKDMVEQAIKSGIPVEIIREATYENIEDWIDWQP